MKKNSAVLGTILILIGAIILLKNLNVLESVLDLLNMGFLIGRFWPIFIIIPAVAMHSLFFTGKSKDAGILVPAGILFILGISFQILTLFNLWGLPSSGFIVGIVLMAVTVGLFELYLFGTRDKGVLVPVTILGSLSMLFLFRGFLVINLWKYIVPSILIVVGGSIIIKNITSKGEKED